MNSASNSKDLIELCLAKNLLFACYYLPNTSVCRFVIQKDTKLQSFSMKEIIEQQKGFVVMPFDVEGEHEKGFIRADIWGDTDSINWEEVMALQDNQAFNEDCPESMVKSDYLNSVQTIVDRLQEDPELEKVVFSRIMKIDKPNNFRETDVFERFSKAYSSAFSYILNIPNKGRWMGASPETLVQIENTRLRTMALAGTQKLDERALEDITWSTKDQEEHFFVSNYIEDQFDKFGLKKYHKKGPYTVASAQVLHLQTAYEIELEDFKDQLGDFVMSLHPTPAVGGCPRNKALDYLKGIEHHDREYYSGFLGPVNMDDTTRLFVNLRCMKLGKYCLALYIGGGITANSNANLEWEETCLKAQTILSAL